MNHSYILENDLHYSACLAALSDSRILRYMMCTCCPLDDILETRHVAFDEDT